MEFLPATPDAWVGNFAPGLGGYSGVHLHPNGVDIAVFSGGSGYVINPRKRDLKERLPGEITYVWEVMELPGLVCDRQGLAFFLIGPAGLVWHTRRLSWDGFREVRLMANQISGLAFGLEDVWLPFEVDLQTGRSDGGAVPNGIDADWERLATNRSHRTPG